MAFFDFLKKPVKAVQRNAGNVARSGFHFLEDNPVAKFAEDTFIPGQAQVHDLQRQTLKSINDLQNDPGFRQAAQNGGSLVKKVEDLKLKVNDVQRDALREGRDLGVSVARGFAKVPETIVRSAAQATSAPGRADLQRKLDEVDKIDTSYLPPDKLAQLKVEKDRLRKMLSEDSFNSGENKGLREALYGKEPVKTYQNRAEGIKEVVDKSRFKGASLPIAIAATGANLVGDVTPVGGSGKKAGLSVFEDLAKTASVTEVKKVLSRKVIPDVLDKVAPAIAKATDPHVVSRILGSHGVDIASLGEDVAKKAPQVITRSPVESKELTGLVQRGKLHPNTEIVGRDTLKLGEGTTGVGIDKKQVAKYVEDIKGGKTIDPLVVTNDGKFINDGQNRLAAFDQLGVKEVPIVREMNTKALTVPRPSASTVVDVTKAPPVLPQVGTISDIVPKTTPTLREATLPTTQEDVKSVAQSVADKLRGGPAAKGESPVPGIAGLQEKQKALNATERAARIAKSNKAAEGLTGEEALKAQTQALAGNFGKVDSSKLVESVQKAVPEEDYNKTLELLRTHADLNDYEKINAAQAWRQFYRDGKLPTPSQSSLWDKALGTNFTSAALDHAANIAPGAKMFSAAKDLLGNARSAKSTLDLSMGGRQGLFVAGRHPVQWAEANKESIKYAANTKYYEGEMKKIADDAWIKVGRSHGLDLTGIYGHEEAYAATDIVGKVPGVKAAERAYTGGLTKLRGELFKSRLQQYGATPEEAIKTLGSKGVNGLSETINTLTGRGGKAGGWVQKHATTLQEALFSPRLWASRLQPFNPKFWARIGPAGRAEAIQSLGSFAAVAGVVLGAAVAAGATVEQDPRSSDFLKIKVGDTRYDILGGLQQNLVFLARELSGSSKSSQTGKITEYGKFGGPNRLTALYDLVRNKSNPIVSSAANILEGKDKAGNKINPFTEIGQLFVPLSIQGTYHAAQRDGLKGVAKNAPDFFGVGSQTYGTRDIKVTDKQQAYIDNLKQKGATKDQLKATQSFFQLTKAVPDVAAARGKIEEALNSGDKTKAVSLAKAYNTEYSKTFKDWADQYGKQYGSKDLTELYNKGKITNTDLKTISTKIKKDKVNKAKGVVKL